MPEIGLQAFALIGKEEGIKGYWKGNLPQVFASFSHRVTFLVDFR